ncbi:MULTISPECIES: fumarate reductase (CoM/CoB) subunit TfrA [Methanothermobacter]|jgi:fumarate reductase (CoM/CoB) subunit A|nr:MULTISPECIES: fumarate reductase (CoM/CoB) subunit TfrA [Methanothermobacter]MDK2874184.1 fumarate reductase (CoM/CoB) subunit [Methanothermobacter sp.]MDN5373375.1 fumarate reductase (CoM/CoB) subunit [Methanothermobacter sp.]NLU03538.1 fumarate reductase subunit A [Methanothermobacter sp.]WBF06007.1 fumarate reductase subunit A [Methanothermobacter thermautotrophicus]BAZ99496.1 L-aspartate oxidase [Methanothermobacter sp. EMTCatA1]
MESQVYECDVLIIGSGGAGCRAAIEVSEHNLTPLIVSKGLSFKSGCTGMAEGGYNAAFACVDPEDSPDVHFEDTMRGGGFLNDPQLVRILVDEAPDRLRDLETYGALFDRQESGLLDQRPFGGQTYRRTCYQGDRTGHEMITALKEEVIRRDIETVEEIMITSLLVEEDRVLGAMGVSIRDSSTVAFRASSTILAAGGAGHIYPVTSNTIQKGGDGFSVAWKAGADLIDMEQVQFHPTGMVYPESRRGVLVTEAVRGEGGILLNSEGERFMKRYDPRGELATRDVVARAIYTEIMEGRGTGNGGVYLDVSHLPDEVIEEKLETMLLQFQDVGIDIRSEPMEVAPTAHHFMGGVRIDEWGRTNLRNLFAAGEVTGGVHGANRLGGNALADTQVFGRRAGIAAARNAIKSAPASIKSTVEEEEYRIKSMVAEGSHSPSEIRDRLHEAMWNGVAIVRSRESLESARAVIQDLTTMMGDLNVPETSGFNTYLIEALELENMLVTSSMVVESALIREESRGSHYRKDFPETRPEWLKSIVLNRNRRPGFIERGLKSA